MGCLGADGFCHSKLKSYEECETDFVSGSKWCEGNEYLLQDLVIFPIFFYVS